MTTDKGMAEALMRQADAAVRSQLVDRTGWSRDQWVAEAQVLMDELDGAVTSLVNGHALALLDEVSEQREAIAKIRALHKPWYEYPDGRRFDHLVSVDDAADLPADHVCRIGAGAACYPEEGAHQVLACVECRQATEDGDPAYLIWPCATIVAIEGPR